MPKYVKNVGADLLSVHQCSKPPPVYPFAWQQTSFLKTFQPFSRRVRLVVKLR